MKQIRMKQILTSIVFTFIVLYPNVAVCHKQDSLRIFFEKKSIKIPVNFILPYRDSLYNKYMNNIMIGKYFIELEDAIWEGFYLNNNQVKEWYCYNKSPWYLKIKKKYSLKGEVLRISNYSFYDKKVVLLSCYDRINGTLKQVSGYNIFEQLIIKNFISFGKLILLLLGLRLILNYSCIMKTNSNDIFFNIPVIMFKLYWNEKSSIFKVSNFINFLFVVLLILFISFAILLKTIL